MWRFSLLILCLRSNTHCIQLTFPFHSLASVCVSILILHFCLDLPFLLQFLHLVIFSLFDLLSAEIVHANAPATSDCQTQGILSDSHLPLASVPDHSLLEVPVMLFSEFYCSDFLFHRFWFLFLPYPLNISSSDFNSPLVIVVVV